jgi:acetyltransferase-like isoleucine patch superfamily enzyme
MRIVDAVISEFYYRFKFKSFGYKSRIVRPLRIDGYSNIAIGDRVYVQFNSWLAALPLTGSHECCLSIGNGTIIGHFNHIYATKKIIIEENVLIADKVYISDNIHSYSNINEPILTQPIHQRNEVVIGSGSWIGENVCIIGSKIGRNCVIGANAVVTKDIPDYCVAVGVPAIIVKRYCHDRKVWEKTNENGDFIKENLL